jgi:hypothetical protein
MSAAPPAAPPRVKPCDDYDVDLLFILADRVATGLETLKSAANRVRAKDGRLPRRLTPQGPKKVFAHFDIPVTLFGLIAYEIIGDLPVFPNGQSSPTLPELPIEFGFVMQELIPQCWFVNPAERPSLREIFELFASCGFAILPGADGTAIGRAVSEVLAAEKRLGRIG